MQYRVDASFLEKIVGMSLTALCVENLIVHSKTEYQSDNTFSFFVNITSERANLIFIIGLVSVLVCYVWIGRKKIAIFATVIFF